MEHFQKIRGIVRSDSAFIMSPAISENSGALETSSSVILSHVFQFPKSDDWDSQVNQAQDVFLLQTPFLRWKSQSHGPNRASAKITGKGRITGDIMAPVIIRTR